MTTTGVGRGEEGGEKVGKEGPIAGAACGGVRGKIPEEITGRRNVVGGSSSAQLQLCLGK